MSLTQHELRHVRRALGVRGLALFVLGLGAVLWPEQLLVGALILVGASPPSPVSTSCRAPPHSAGAAYTGAWRSPTGRCRSFSERSRWASFACRPSPRSPW